MTIPCQHELTQRETAVSADGMCPLCLANENLRLRELVQVLLDNDPDEPIADNGMTVLDGWRSDARLALSV